MGVAVILTCGAIGVAWRYGRRFHLADLSWGELYLFGWIIHLVMLGCTVFLPHAARWRVAAAITLPVMTIYPVGTAVLGKLMAHRLKRERINQNLRESEERYETLASISPVGIFRTDRQGSATYVNPMWRRLSGLPEKGSMGKGWLRAVHPDDRESVTVGWRRMIDGCEPFLSDFRFLHDDGTVTWVLGMAVPEADAEKRCAGYVGTITDISERKRSEETIRSSLKEKEVLLKEVHHRVKNNLMTIIGLIRMQAEKTRSGGTRQMLVDLEGRVRSMALVHENLYKFSNLARVDLQSYIETIVNQFRTQFEAGRKIEFQVQAAKIELDLNTAVPCGLILNEILTNVFKHAFPDGKPAPGNDSCRIRVCADRGDGTFSISVADNGVGLPGEVDWKSAETLGLRLIAMLSSQVHGSVTVDRCEGTAFKLTFPLGADS
jgi:PAS domain S-box-containing protein